MNFGRAHRAPEFDTLEFGMRVVRNNKTSFDRQVMESVLIQQSRHHHLLNSRSEYDRCALRRMICKLGDKNFKENELEISRDLEKEEMQVSRIRDLTKARNKLRGQNNRIQRKPPPAKRRKPNETEEEPHPEIQEMQRKEREEADLAETVQDKKMEQPKRKPEKLEEQSRKRIRVEQDIRNHFPAQTPSLDAGDAAEDTEETGTTRDNKDTE